MPLQKLAHYTELLKQAKVQEAEGEWLEAARTYEQVIRQHPLEENAYNRLMIIYRKLRDPKKELKVINKGLETFTDYHDKKLKVYSGNDAIGKLSKALLKSVSGKTGKMVEYPQPVPRWTKRKEAVEKKIR